jgi:hypothetical protein
MRERLLSSEEVRMKSDTCGNVTSMSMVPMAGRRRLAFLPYAAREIVGELITRHSHA